MNENGDTSDDSDSNWREMEAVELTGNGYGDHVVRGWRNTETFAEVLVFDVDGSDLPDQMPKPWGVQHPFTDDMNSSLRLTDSREEAEEFAKKWIENHPNPPNIG